MKKIFTFSIVLMSFFYAEIKAQSSYTVRRGERPPIDLQALPIDAYEKGILKIKIDESFTNQMDINPVIVNENGIVSFNITSIDQLSQKYRPTGFDKLFGKESSSSKFYERHRAWGFHLWYTLYFDEKTDIKELVAAYGQLDEISIAEPQYKTELLVSEPITSQTKSEEEKQEPSQTDWTPNDPSFNLQWHYHNTGQQGGTVDADIDLPEAWNIEKGNSNVIVSIHDMGVQYNHPDLSGNMWINSDEIAGNGIDDDSNGYIDDIYGWDFYNNNSSIEAGYHGTHVAGTVAAESNNLIGVSGVAGGSGSNDGVRLMTCMVYHPTISGGIGHHLAPVYAADNGACIEQNSWGYTNPNSYDQAVLDAIDYFNINGGGTALSGGITIYAAGNSNSNGNYYPGCYSGTFAVAATNNQDIKSYYSNYGTWVDISAPGGETNVVTARGVYSTYTTNTYNYLQGTSMACPHVSGVAALIVSYAYGELIASEVADILRNTTDNHYGVNPGYIGQLGTGRLNAYQALLETENYLGTPGLWTGTVSTSWNNGANWDDGTVPTSAVDVTIPAGTPYQPVISAGMTAYAKNLTIQSGALLTHTGTTSSWFYVYGDFNSDAGQYTMTGISFLYFAGSVSNSWDDDNENDTYVNVRVEKDLGSNANTYMWQNMTCSGTFEIREGIFSIDQYWTLNITNTGTTAFEVEAGGNLILDAATEVITVAGNIHFFDGSQATLTNGTINCAKDFIVDANASYNIAFTGGTLVMNGSSTQYINDSDGGNLDLFNLTIAKTGGVCYIQSANLDVNGDLLISGGSLSCNNAPSPTATYNINIAGTWTNNVGTSGFIESTGRVIFDKPTAGIQLINSTEHFNILECATVSATAGIRPAGSANVSCNVYDWTSGGVSTVGSTFTANDLADNSLYGFFYALSNSQIILNEQTSYVDLIGNLIVGNNALLQINGGADESYWASSVTNNVTVETGGVLDFADVGIYIWSSGTLIYDIQSGSTIKVGRDFICTRTDFNPAGGTLEFHGGSDGIFSMAAGSTLYDVSINKTGGDKSIGQNKDRKGNLVDFTKSNSVYLSTDVVVNNNVVIQNGILSLNGHQLTVTNNCDVYGTLTMNNALDILNVGTNYEDVLIFHSGSTGLFNFGTVNIYGWIRPRFGCFFSATTNNTVYFKGVTGGGPWNDEPTAVYGHMVVDKNPGERTYASASSLQPITLLGNFTVNPNNEFELQNNTMHVNGFLTDNTSSEIYAWDTSKNSSSKSASVPDEAKGIVNSIDTDNNTGIEDTGSKGGYLEIDNNFTLNGLMDVGDGNVLIHGMFNVAASGTLTITTGSLICDAPSTSVAYVAGNFNLGEGLFEIRNNSLNMYPVTSSITGGIIKAGGTFIANMADRFKPGFGTVELINGVNGHYIQMHSTNYFNHLIVNRAHPIGIYSGTSLTVKKDLTINAGGLNSNNLPIYLGGYWNENMGPSGFGEGTGTVYFNGIGAVPIGNQYINGPETFYNIENAKSGGGNLFFNGAITVSNNFLANDENIVNGPSLNVNNLLLSTGILGMTAGAPIVTVNNFTMGGYLSVTNGNFTCTDITNNGVYGTIEIYNGTVTLNQDALQYPDLNATLNIQGGSVVINGGNGASYWGFNAPCSVTMSNGVLDFINNGIFMDNIYPLTESITGGTIKTNRDFYTSHVNFTPSGGTLEMYGGTDAQLGVFNNSSLFNLLINKSGGDKDFSFETFASAKQGNEVDESISGTETFSAKKSDRPEFPVSNSKSNTVYTSALVKVNGTTTVEEGTFLVDNYVTTCMNNINVNAGGRLAIGDFGTLAVENGKILSVNTGGFLDVIGSVGGAATITQNTGYYAFKVQSGGTIAAQYGIFEYMDLYGIYLYSGSLVDPVNSFNNCTFRYQNPVASSSLFTIAGPQVFTASNASFPVNTGANTYNVWKYDNAGDITFFNASGAFAGPEFEYDPYSHVQWTMTPYNVSLTVFLEGPFNTSTNLMNTGINTLLPLGQPYGTPPPGNPTPDWLYTGTEIVPAIPSASIVDWVEVQLRDATTAAGALPARVIARKVGFLLNNGVVVGLDGLNPLSFNSYFGHNLYAVIWHRNHLGVLSANSLAPVGGGYSYNFSTGLGQAYTTGIPAQKLLAAGIYGMKSGDGNGNGLVETTDKTVVWSTQAGKTGYREGDYNMNKQVNNPDKDDKWLPNIGSGSFIPE